MGFVTRKLTGRAIDEAADRLAEHTERAIDEVIRVRSAAIAKDVDEQRARSPEKGEDFDPAIWNEWEKTGAGKALAMPGAVEALRAMRAAGVKIIANTNRTAANATGTEDSLGEAGLGEFKHGETLYLMGDDATGSSKDGRRASIAAKYCVIALAGDQLGDFAQAFNAKGLSVLDRKKLATNPAIASLWGNGWFLFSNPVYGPSIRGGYDEIFTPETKWEPNP